MTWAEAAPFKPENQRFAHHIRQLGLFSAKSS